MFQYAGKTVRSNAKIARMAVEKDPSMFEYLSKELQNDEEFIVINQTSLKFKYGGKKVRGDSKFARLTVQTSKKRRRVL